jgi:hypothetical protein
MWQKQWESGRREIGNNREQELVSHVPLLNDKDIECMVMDKKKREELISKYMGEDIMEE